MDATLEVCGRYSWFIIGGIYESQEKRKWWKEWLEEALTIIEDNFKRMKAMLEEKLPKVWIPNLEGTYLMWIDLGAYISPKRIEEVLQNQCHLAVDYGEWFS